MMTSPLTAAASRISGIHLSDVLLPGGEIVRAVAPTKTIQYLGRGGIVLPRPARDTRTHIVEGR